MILTFSFGVYSRRSYAPVKIQVAPSVIPEGAPALHHRTNTTTTDRGRYGWCVKLLTACKVFSTKGWQRLVTFLALFYQWWELKTSSNEEPLPNCPIHQNCMPLILLILSSVLTCSSVGDSWELQNNDTEFMCPRCWIKESWCGRRIGPKHGFISQRMTETVNYL